MFDLQSAVQSVLQSADCTADSHIHSNMLYRWVIYQKYDRRGCESPSGYGLKIT